MSDEPDMENVRDDAEWAPCPHCGTDYHMPTAPCLTALAERIAALTAERDRLRGYTATIVGSDPLNDGFRECLGCGSTLGRAVEPHSWRDCANALRLSWEQSRSEHGQTTARLARAQEALRVFAVDCLCVGGHHSDCLFALHAQAIEELGEGK